MQIDNNVIHYYSSIEGLEILPLKEALNKYDWLEDYLWKLIDKNKDEYTKQVEDNLGYFIRVKKNVHVKIPIQACLLIRKKEFRQKVHNIIIAEENSSIDILTGCATPVEDAFHIGVSEFYLKKGSKVRFTMIHAWRKNVEVRPRTAALVEDKATFISTYVNINPVKSLQMLPTAYCRGKESSAYLYSVIYGKEKSNFDIGGEIVLEGENSKGEIISRILAADESRITVKSIIEGNNIAKGHIECNALLTSNKSFIEAIPKLIAKNENAELTHEASIGKINEEEIYYLMTRGLSEKEAKEIIVKGFLGLDMFLPKYVKDQIEFIISKDFSQM